MEVAALIVSFGVLVVSGAAAAAAVVQARAANAARVASEAARNESMVARDDAARLASEANDAFKRQAAAQELANEIELAKRPKPHVEWQPQQGGGRDIRLLVNVGNIPAINVVATGGAGVHTDEDSRSLLVVPGDSIAYYVMPTMGGVGRPRLRVEWNIEGEETVQVWERAVQ